MGRWLNRADKRLLESVSPTDVKAIAPLADWISEPDLSAVTGFVYKYWTITGDVISLKSQAERNAIDAAEDTSQLDAIANELTQTRSIMRAFAEVVLDEINILRVDMSPPGTPRTLVQLRNAVRSKL